ncbi:MAG: Peptidase inactive domain protein [Devosia sp.]|uniref:M16 family metallopeptidase n=1 Tax=Devosia sp. TaxID=1871048 RepID=UPI0026049B08|nr:pitrilysin family protein [Devosia sp.]MDB5527670.1 Peptidase inactive domain protein [Devosia sp.]
MAVRFISTLVVAALTLFAIVPAQAEVVFQDVTSPKGIHAWLVEDYSVPIVTIRFSFSGGTSQDPVGKEGLANLMTSLFDEGAGDLDSDTFQIKLDDAGAEMSFSADQDAVHGSMRMLADQQPEAFGLLKMSVESPRFDQNPIDRMRSQIVSGIMANAQRPETAANEQWAKTLYGDHPYSRTNDGTIAGLTTVTAADLRAFHRAMFARSNLHIGVVGAIDAETLKTRLDQVFGDLPAEAALTPVPDIVPKLGQDVGITYNLPQTTIYMAYPGVQRADPDFFAAYVMNYILGGGDFSSRLFAEVREKRGLTYGVSSSLQNSDHADSLVIGTATRADRAGETLKVIQDVIAGLAKDGPTEAELASAKKYIIGSYAINSMSSSVAIANTLVGLQDVDLPIDYVAQRPALINAVTLEQVKAAAAKLLSVKPTILLLGPAATPADVPTPTPAPALETPTQP